MSRRRDRNGLCQNRRCRAALCRLYRRAGAFRRDDRTARVYPEGLCIDPRLLCAHPARSDPQRRYADRIGRIGSTCQRSPRIDARQGVSFDGCRAGRLEDMAGQLRHDLRQHRLRIRRRSEGQELRSAPQGARKRVRHDQKVSEGVPLLARPLSRKIGRSSHHPAGQQHLLEQLDGLLLLQDRQQAQVARRRQCGDDLPQHAGRPVEQLAVGITALSGRGARHSRTADLLSRNRRRQQGRSYDRIPGRLPHRLRAGDQRMDQPAESRRQKVPRRDFRRSERQ